MGHRLVIGDGIDSAENARYGFGHSAARLRARLFGGRDRVRFALRLYRLARLADGGHGACCIGFVHTDGGQGIARVGRAAPAAKIDGLGGVAAGSLETIRVRDFVNDWVQFFQPRNAGFVSHLLASAAEIFDARGECDFDRRESRRDHRRNLFWSMVAARRSATCDHHRGAVGFADDSAVGL